MAGVIDPDIDALKVVQGEADDAVDLFAIGNVAGERQSIFGVANAGAGSFGAGGVAREQNDPAAAVNEEFGNCFTDAHRSAGHDHDFPREI
jgi:hypothetical protein